MTVRQLFAGVALCVSCVFMAPVANATVITFDDVVGSQVDVTNRYAGLGVTLNAIANPFPLSGPFPSPPTLPAVLGGVTTWTDGFASAVTPTQVAVAAETPETGIPGRGGILISFAFAVASVSLVGNDLGGIGFGDDENVTLTAYDSSGAQIGQVYSTTNLAGGLFDRTPATISLAGIRSVAFNYTNTDFGFYAIDNLEFEPAVAPEPLAGVLLSVGVAALLVARRRTCFRSRSREREGLCFSTACRATALTRNECAAR